MATSDDDTPQPAALRRFDATRVLGEGRATLVLAPRCSGKTTLVLELLRSGATVAAVDVFAGGVGGSRYSAPLHDGGDVGALRAIIERHRATFDAAGYSSGRQLQRTVVFDDASTELIRSREMRGLLMNGRCFGFDALVATQYLPDPAMRHQFDFLFVRSPCAHDRRLLHELVGDVVDYARFSTALDECSANNHGWLVIDRTGRTASADHLFWYRAPVATK